VKKKNKRNFNILRISGVLLLLALIFLGATVEQVAARKFSAVSASELIIVVNGLRTANGLNALTPDSLLTIAAQSHSEYQASLGYWTHEGPGGTNETDRAAAVGYGAGQGIKCDEAVAIASSSKDANYIVYDLWGDYVHRNVVLLNSKYVHIGAGVANGADGLYYYTVDLCVIDGQAPAYPTAAAGNDENTNTNGPTPTYAPLITATPLEDGSIWHRVQPGETIFDISVSYGVAELDILTMNGISPAFQVIYAGDLLLIKTAPPPTVTPTTTATPKPPTRTPRPSKTPRPTRPTTPPENTPTVTPTATPVPGYYQTLDQLDQRQWGLVIISISSLGIMLLFGKDILLWLKKLKGKQQSKLAEQAGEMLDTDANLPPTTEIGSGNGEDQPMEDESLEQGTAEEN
jgi:uncharacterized protein YkwD